MAYGLPVITTNKCVAGIEMVEEGINGTIIMPDDVEELVKAMIHWTMNGKATGNMASLKKARQYTIEKMALRHYEILTNNI